MRYYIIAGEASGDLHGSNLIKGLRAEDPEAEFRFRGGDLMQDAAGEAGTLVRHYKEGAVMGLGDVLAKAGKLLGDLSSCKKDIAAWAPDVVVLIDYPGFNMKIAEYCHRQGIKVFYYIAPKTWASREGRNRKLRSFVDRLFIVFPFEIPYFSAKGIPFEYEGNPLLDAVDGSPAMKGTRESFLAAEGIADSPYIAILAGSRKGEISRMMPVCMEVARSMAAETPELRFIVAGAPARSAADYDIPADLAGRVDLVFGKTYEVLRHAEAAIINSGTASLEAALIGTPQVVCWSTGAFTAFIARKVLHVMDNIRFISLGNLCVDRLVFRELIQEDFTPAKVKAELDRLMKDPAYRQEMLDGYSQIRNSLGGTGASRAVARKMIQTLK